MVQWVYCTLALPLLQVVPDWSKLVRIPLGFVLGSFSLVRVPFRADDCCVGRVCGGSKIELDSISHGADPMLELALLFRACWERLAGTRANIGHFVRRRYHL